MSRDSSWAGDESLTTRSGSPSSGEEEFEKTHRHACVVVKAVLKLLLVELCFRFDFYLMWVTKSEQVNTNNKKC